MGIGIRLELRLGVTVRVMARAWVGVRLTVLFCSSMAQFLTILCIPHCADEDWVWHIKKTTGPNSSQVRVNI